MTITPPIRPIEIASFLDQEGWGEASAACFPGDFSKRRYARLTKSDGSTAILMDADTDQKSDIFVKVAAELRHLGIAAPEIYAAAPERGLVLLEDFGTRNLGAALDAKENPKPFFLRAVEILAKLHKSFRSSPNLGVALPLFNKDLFTGQAELFLDSYFPYHKGREVTKAERQDFCAAWQATLRPLDLLPQSLLLRDFMPDNLMVLPSGALGVLDFQDAGLGPIAYELASLCEEVRRSGSFAILPEMITHYRKTSESALSQTDLLRACTILSAQRHMRILGIIAQLAIQTGRKDKLDYLPRIRGHLSRILEEPYLIPVHEWVERTSIL